MREGPPLDLRGDATDTKVKGIPRGIIVSRARLPADRRGVEEKAQHESDAPMKGGAVAVPLGSAHAAIPIVGN